MDINDLGSIGEVIAALATVGTLLYLASQIRQSSEIAKAQFGLGLTQRIYDRYLRSTQDPQLAEFLSKDWADSANMSETDKWRLMTFFTTLFVDLFDVYDKVESGLVDRKHLDLRVHLMQLGIFKTPAGQRSWGFWKLHKDQEFITWFEHNILQTDSPVKKLRDKNPEDSSSTGQNFFRD